jgi:polar amino acid transport system substrate-binding protein
LAAPAKQIPAKQIRAKQIQEATVMTGGRTGAWRTTAVAAAVAALLGVLAAARPAAADLLDTIREKKLLVIGTSNDAPLSYIDSKTNAAAGVLPDILREVLRREAIDATLQVVAMPFASLIPAVQSGRIDLMGDAMYIRPARQKVMDFTDGIFFNPESLDVAAGNPKHLHKPADLCGHAAGTYEGTVYVDMLKKVAAACPAGKTLEVQLYPTIQNVFADLSTGRIDAAVVDSTLSAYALKENPALNFELVGDYVPESKADTLCAFAVGKDANAKFVAAFNKDYAAMKADGTAARLFSTWGLTPTDFFLNP